MPSLSQAADPLTSCRLSHMLPMLFLFQGPVLPDPAGQHPPHGGQQQEHPGGPLPRHQVHQPCGGAEEPGHCRQNINNNNNTDHQPNQTYHEAGSGSSKSAPCHIVLSTELHLKGQCHKIFDPLFFQDSNPSGSVIHTLYYEVFLHMVATSQRYSYMQKILRGVIDTAESMTPGSQNFNLSLRISRNRSCFRKYFNTYSRSGATFY